MPRGCLWIPSAQVQAVRDKSLFQCLLQLVTRAGASQPSARVVGVCLLLSVALAWHDTAAAPVTARGRAPAVPCVGSACLCVGTAVPAKGPVQPVCLFSVGTAFASLFTKPWGFFCFGTVSGTEGSN